MSVKRVKSKDDSIVLYNGDCLEVMDKFIDKGGIDMILTDPPYGTTACKWDSVIPFDPMWKCINNLIKDDGAIVLFGNQPFTAYLIASNVINFKYTWVWEKSLKTNFLNARKQPLRSHEDIAVFYRKQCVYNPQGLREGSISGGNRITEIYGEWKGKSNQTHTGYPVSVIKIPNPNNASMHPTQKPVALLEYLIKTYTNENDVILDFTMGSGSTGVACRNLKRRFIGIEKDNEYFNIAKERIFKQSKEG